MPNILSTKAMLSGLSVTQWTARKLDRKVTNETNHAHGAAADAGRYNKALLAKDALSALQSIASAARTEHYAKTLPWLDNGARILPAALYQDYSESMRKAREAFETAVAEFLNDYPSFVADARLRLNGMWNAADYPDASEIARKFSFSVALYPVPDAADFRVDVSASQAAAIRTGIEARAKEALETAMRDAWQRIADSVGHMASKLSEFKPAQHGDKAAGIFRDSLVENVRELVGILPALNLTDNPNLTAISGRMAELVKYDAETLRASDHLRRSIQEQAAAILADVSAFI